MLASFLDLRKNSKEILQALDRNESVTLLYRGKPKAVITPIEQETTPQASETAAFGIWADREDLVDPTEYIQNARRKPRHDL